MHPEHNMYKWNFPIEFVMNPTFYFYSKYHGGKKLLIVFLMHKVNMHLQRVRVEITHRAKGS